MTVHDALTFTITLSINCSILANNCDGQIRKNPAISSPCYTSYGITKARDVRDIITRKSVSNAKTLSKLNNNMDNIVAVYHLRKKCCASYYAEVINKRLTFPSLNLEATSDICKCC